MWLSLPTVFFLLIEYAPFLRFVEREPRSRVNKPIPLIIDKMHLGTIQLDAAMQTIESTRVMDGLGRWTTVKAAVTMDDREVEALALRLFEQARGCSVALVNVFKKCSTFEDLTRYTTHRCDWFGVPRFGVP